MTGSTQFPCCLTRVQQTTKITTIPYLAITGNKGLKTTLYYAAMDIRLILKCHAERSKITAVNQHVDLIRIHVANESNTSNQVTL